MTDFDALKPWLTEPDFEQWTHEGMKCEVRRNRLMGHLCGYVYLPDEHKLRGVSINELSSIDVHGGVTFFDGEKAGFDCAHAGDLQPYHPYGEGVGFDTYRSLEWVKAETNHMADQLAKVK